MIHELSATVTLPDSPRARRRAQRTEAILEAATEIVVDGGLDGLTVHRLADRLDLTVGALYRYFRGKDAIVAALQRRAAERFGRLLELALRARRDAVAIDEPEERALADLLVVADLYAGLARVAPAEFAVHAALLGDPRVLVDDDDAVGSVGAILALVVRIGELFGAARACTALAADDAGDLDRAISYLTGLHGVLSLRKVTRLAAVTVDPERLGRTLTRTLLLGWGASEPTIVRAAGRIDALAATRSIAERAADLEDA